MKGIVVATDGSAAASAALDEAIAIAKGTGDHLAVITVWRALQGDFGLAYPSGALLNELLDAERDHAEATLAEAVELGAAAGVTVETHLLTGDPAQTVCRFAKEHDARMIAVGTHGYGTMMSLLMGSVSGDIIRGAHCPVLVTHTSPTGGSRGHAPGTAIGRRS